MLNELIAEVEELSIAFRDLPPAASHRAAPAQQITAAHGAIMDTLRECRDQIDQILAAEISRIRNVSRDGPSGTRHTFGREPNKRSRDHSHSAERLRSLIRSCEGQHASGLEILHTIADAFDAALPPEPSGVVFHGSSVEREQLVPYTSVRRDLPDPDQPAVFWTPSPQVAAFCAIFNRQRYAAWVNAGSLPDDALRRADVPKAWVPRFLDIEAPRHVLEQIQRTPGDHALIVTPDMWQAAIATRPSGAVHVSIPVPPIEPPGSIGDHYISSVPVRALAVVQVTFDEIAPSIVQAEKGTVRLVWTHREDGDGRSD